jgi:hypothetical protein
MLELLFLAPEDTLPEDRESAEFRAREAELADRLGLREDRRHGFSVLDDAEVPGFSSAYIKDRGFGPISLPQGSSV